MLSEFVKGGEQAKFKHYNKIINGFKQDERMKKVDDKLIAYLKEEYRRGYKRELQGVSTSDLI